MSSQEPAFQVRITSSVAADPRFIALLREHYAASDEIELTDVRSQLAEHLDRLVEERMKTALSIETAKYEMLASAIKNAAVKVGLVRSSAKLTSERMSLLVSELATHLVSALNDEKVAE